jgi:hypothetical protein
MEPQEVRIGTRVSFTDGEGEHFGVVKSIDANGNMAVGQIDPPIANAGLVTKSAGDLTPA